MKKLLALILAAALALSLVACGGGSGAGDNNTPSTGNGETTSTDAPSGSGEDNKQEETSEPQGLKVGDTITNDNFEFTLTSVEFAHELYTFSNEANTTCDDNFMLPLSETETNPGGLKIRAKDGNILLTFTFTYKFIGKSAFSDTFRELGGPCVYYGDGYMFNGNDTSAPSEYAIFVKTDDDNRTEWYILSHSRGLDVHGATELPAINSNYKPLDNTIYTCRGYITVPIEVSENTEESFAISFRKFTEYPERFTIR